MVPTISGSPYQSVALAFPATPTNGGTVTLDFGVNGLDLSSCGNQLVFISDQASMNAWAYWKVDVSANGSTWTTIADPLSSTYNAPVRGSVYGHGDGGNILYGRFERGRGGGVRP